MPTTSLRLAIASFLLVGACGGASTSSTSEPPTTADPATKTPDGTPSTPSTPTGGLDTGGPLSRPVGCTGEGVVNEPMAGKDIFEALRLAAGLDFLERRTIESPDRDPLDHAWPVLGVGTACATATDLDTCTSALAALSSDDVLFAYHLDTFVTRPRGFYLVATKGDSVKVIATPAELRALLPSVSAPVIAYAYAEAANYRVECTRNWVREEPDGFVVLATIGPACKRDKVVLFVRHDGTIETRSTEKGDSPCL